MKRKIITLIISVFLLCLLLFIAPRSTIVYSSICCDCLQHAYTVEKNFLGVSYYKKITLSQLHGGIMSPAFFSPDIPLIDPNLYENIFDKKCKHRFKRGGYGETENFLFVKLCKDGSFLEWDRCNIRVECISSIYRLFVLTKNKSEAKRSFEIIDNFHPKNSLNPIYSDTIEKYNLELKEAKSEIKWIEINDNFLELLETKKLPNSAK